MSNFYDGTKLLSMKDKNGETPEIYMCTTNRSAGKTTFFGRMLVNRFIKKGDKFCLVYRNIGELSSVADKFFKDIRSLFFNDYYMESKMREKGLFYELYLCKGEKKSECGYAVALNSADKIKKCSHLLSDTTSMLFDEFQSETNSYISNEVTKFISLHTSIARGGGEQVRYVPVYMLSNSVTLLNPYYVAMGISARLNSNAKFLKGDGFVVEQGFNESASIAQKQSAFNRAFSGSDYVAYSSENIYLNDNYSFIEKMSGNSKYICTLKYGRKMYAVREYSESGIIYCDDRPDKTHGLRIALSTDDMEINYIMIKNNAFFFNQLRWYFERGCFRFKNLECKEVILKTLSY